MIEQGLGFADSMRQQAFDDRNAAFGITGKQGFPKFAVVRYDRVVVAKARTQPGHRRRLEVGHIAGGDKDRGEERMRQAGVPASRAHQRWMLERMRDLVQPDSADNNDLGRLHPNGYLAAATILRDHGLIGEVPDHAAFTGGDDARP